MELSITVVFDQDGRLSHYYFADIIGGHAGDINEISYNIKAVRAV